MNYSEELILEIDIKHKTEQVFTLALGTHDNIITLYNKIYTEENIKDIRGAKEIFRANLSQLIYEVRNGKIKLPLKYSLDRFEEALEKSDFDWLDYNKYIEFQDWFLRRTKT